MGLRRGLLPFVATALGCLLAPRGPTPRRQAALPTERRDVAGEGAIREDPTLRGRLEELAKDNERSLGAEARVAIRLYVERHEDEEAA